MNDRLWLEQKWRNRLHTLSLFLGLGLLLAAIGWLFGGRSGMVLVVILGGLLLAFGPRLSPALVLRMHRARPLSPYHAGDLFHLTEVLAHRAGLRERIELFFIPSTAMNAFALKLNPTQSAIALTSGLLSRLTPRELAGVIAHEISHLRNKDTQVMQLAAQMNHLVGSFAGFARILLVLNFAFVLLTGTGFSILPLLLMALAPIPSELLQLALSRTREFNADLGAAAITGDPGALASALSKLEYEERSFFRRLLLPTAPQSEWLRTHPASRERIRRLHALMKRPPQTSWHADLNSRHFHPGRSHSPFGPSHIFFV